MTWRRALPALEATLSAAGGTHPDFTRQEARGMAAEQKRKAREERRVQRKRRRAGLGC